MRYVCTICGYVYDDTVEEVPFESLPDDWKCPWCRAPKSAFRPEGRKEAEPAAEHKRYVCTICGYVYDEAKEEVPFASLPDDWKCPWCGAPKSAFEPEQKEEAAPAPEEHSEEDEDLQELSFGQLSALCSNLARGCEKQYKKEESLLFRELADYFAGETPPVQDASVEALSAILQKDIDYYREVRRTADRNGDRGAARVCVWGERVTRMLSALVDRYLKEGEAMLENTGVWVCTVCGFVYIGDQAPELCPVCKVPAWKFEKIEGRA